MPARVSSLSSTSVSFQDDLRTARAQTAPSAHLLQELDLEIVDRIKQMKQLTGHLAANLEKGFKTDMIKMPKDIRSMKMRDFLVKYGGDVDNVLEEQAKNIRIDMPPPPPVVAMPPTRPVRTSRVNGSEIQPPGSARKVPGSAVRPTRIARTAETPTVAPRATRGGRTAMQTPRGLVAPTPGAAVPFTPRVHETPRIARGNEVILSANGSPINVPGTIKGRGKRGRAEVTLQLLNGQEVNLAEEDATTTLDEAAKAAAVEQLLELRAQVEAHLAAMQGGNLTEQPDEEE